MSIDLLLLAVDVVRAYGALAVGAAVLLARPRETNARLIALSGLCTTCYVLLGRQDYAAWIPAPYQIDVGEWAPLLNLARNLTPGLLMILMRRLFTDRAGVPAPLLAAFAAQVFLDGPARWLHLPIPEPIAQVAASGLQTLFVFAALYWTVADWRVDLVETRRRARVVVASVLAVEVTASSLFLRVVIPANSRANYDAYLAISLVEVAVATAFLLWLIRSGLDELLTPVSRRRPPAAVPTEADAPALARLTALMERERLYREPGLSLRALADRVGVPEYRLRRLIHEGLGFRNFNAFLHAHRVREACARLEDPAERRIPILTIALDAGYQSLNTFNRGFREVTGVTPSAYRQAREAEPAKT